MTTQESEKPVWQLRVRRYLDLAFLLVVSLLICALFQPLLNYGGNKFYQLIGRWHFSIQILLISLVTGTLWFILIRLGGFRWRDFSPRDFLRYPPTWFCAVIGVIFYVLMVYCLWAFPEPQQAWAKRIAGVVRELRLWMSPELEYVPLDLPYIIVGVLLGPIFVVAVHVLCSRLENRPKEHPDSDGEQKTLTELTRCPKALIEWLEEEKPVEKPSEDRFGLAVFARRIARILRETPLKTIGLTGAYGCGKSSILNLVDYYLDHPDELEKHLSPDQQKGLVDPKKIIRCRVGAWGLEEGSVSEHILRQVIQELSNSVDGLGLVRLPSQYSSALSDAGSIWCKAAAAFLNAPLSPQDILKRLDKVLACVGKRLVIYLEDLDRNADDKILEKEISPLFDGLHRMDHLSFVFAAGHHKEATNILVRISEHVEAVPNVLRKDVISVVEPFRRHCLEVFPDDIDCLSEENRDSRIGIWRSDRPSFVIDRTEDPALNDPKRPDNAITGLLATPRLLKAALRRTWQAWQNLRGEIDFDDLLVGNVIRAGAPEAFSFIHENIPTLRNSGFDQIDPATKEGTKEQTVIEQNWRKQTESVSWDTSASRVLIEFLFSQNPPKPVPQGVIHFSPTDYWERLNAEEVEDNTIHDQAVLSELVKWKRDRSNHDFPAKLYKIPDEELKNKGHIVRGSISRFAEMFECLIPVRNPGGLLNGDDIRRLSHELFQLVLSDKESAAADDDFPGFEHLRGLAAMNPIENYKEWILEEISAILPRSFGFFCDLYRHWLPRESRGALDLAAAKAREVYEGSTDTFIAALQDNETDRIFKFVTNRVSGGDFNPYEWQWLANLLLKTGKMNPQVIVPQIVPLMVRGYDTPSPQDQRLRFNDEVGMKMFEDNLGEVMGVLAQEINPKELPEIFREIDRRFIEFAKNAAREWLAEHA